MRRSCRKPQFIHSDAHGIIGSQELRRSSAAFHDAVRDFEGWKCFIEADCICEVLIFDFSLFFTKGDSLISLSYTHTQTLIILAYWEN